MSIMSIQDFVNLKEPILAELFWNQYYKEKFISDRLFTEKTSDKQTETVLTLTTPGQLEQFQGSVSYEELKEAYKTEFDNVEFAKGLKFQRKFIVTNQYPEYFDDSTRMLARSAAMTREQRSMDIFNNAFNTTYFTAGDGKALCASDHPVPSGLFTNSNITTDPLSPTAITAGRAAMRQFRDYNGEPIDAIADKLLVHPDREDEAKRYIYSTLLPDSANNDINPNKNKLEVISSVRLTDPNRWFLISTDLMNMALRRYVVIQPEFGAIRDFDSLAAKFRAYYFFSVGFNNWNWIYGGDA